MIGIGLSAASGSGDTQLVPDRPPSPLVFEMSGFENASRSPITSSQSYTRMESPDQNSGGPSTPLPSVKEGQADGPDVFERRGSADSSTAGDGQAEEGFVLSRSLQDPSEELPIELISLADR